MTRLLLLASTAILIFIVSSCSQKPADDLLFIKAGPFKNTKSNYSGKNTSLYNFFIGRYEVTQAKWMELMESNPSKFKGNDLPVESVSWYDCIEYCNKRSKKEGLQLYYNIDKATKDT